MLDLNKDGLVKIALPKGRIFQEISPLLESIDINIEPEIHDDRTRKLWFKTNHKNIIVLKVRSFDAVTFVNYHGADIAIAGSDVIKEFQYANTIDVLDLNLGKCRLSVAMHNEKINANQKIDKSFFNHIYTAKVATKYPRITQSFFAEMGVQSEYIKLNGTIELSALLGMSDYIIDLVSTGNTLRENDLTEIIKIMDISSHLVVNKNSLQQKHSEIKEIIDQIKKNFLLTYKKSDYD